MEDVDDRVPAGSATSQDQGTDDAYMVLSVNVRSESSQSGTNGKRWGV
jgi:hypothetical protein